MCVTSNLDYTHHMRKYTRPSQQFFHGCEKKNSMEGLGLRLHYCYSLVKTSTNYSLVVHNNVPVG